MLQAPSRQQQSRERWYWLSSPVILSLPCHGSGKKTGGIAGFDAVNDLKSAVDFAKRSYPSTLDSTQEGGARYEAFSTGDIHALDRVFSSAWRDNSLPANRAPGLEGLKTALTTLRAIVPDVRATVEDVRMDRDVVVIRIRFTGTNTGGVPGVPPNGRPVDFLAFDQHRIAKGKVIESWHLEDNFTLMKQLGVI